MDALKLNFKLLSLGVFAFLTACSNNDSGDIDPKAKQSVLANTMLLSVKKQCLPVNIIDEEDIPWLLHYGYTANPDNSYCLPPIEADDGDDTVSNCIREVFVDETDLVFLTDHGYLPGPNDDYCLVLSGGNSSGGSTTGGSTTGGSTSGGSTSGGSTTGDTSGGSVSGGSTTGETSGSTTGGGTSGGSTTGDTSGGSVSGGSTTGETSGSTTGDGTSGGSTSGGSTTGDTTGGSVSGGSTTGETSGSTTGGGTSGGSTTGDTSGGSVSGGSTTGETSGSTTGGSTSGGSTSGGDNNGGSVSGGSTSGSSSGGESSGGSTSGGSTTGGTSGGSTSGGSTSGGDTCHDWSVGIDRMCSRIRTTSGRYKLRDRLELILKVVKKVKTYTEVEVCKEDKLSFLELLFGSGNSKSSANSNHKHDSRCGHSHDEPKVVCKKEKKETVSYVSICESHDTDKIKNDVIKKRRLDFTDCDIRGYDKKDLFVTLYSPVVGSDHSISSSSYDNVRFFAKDSSDRGKDELSFILYGSRENRYVNIREKIVVIIDDNPDFNSTVDKKECDQKASPLIVHINPNRDQAKYVELSSMEEGLEFDILGLNAEPRAHAPRQISWLNSDQYMFLVKPNKRGRVEGVNEMFGDNTYGPDKDFSPNGFIALAKYDADGDGLINKRDAVYSQLRLWRDINFDGVSTPNELFSLERMGVKAIDLNYDPGFAERDIYGNETLYKSVIQYHDGSLDLIFDLWFNYKK